MSREAPIAFEEILARAAGLRLLVVGDVMLDEYRSGEVERISPEAPVPIVRVRAVRCELGGAANVARNLVALGASVRLVGVVGIDREGELVRARAAAIGLPVDGLVEVAGRPTTHKLRVVAQAQQMLRLDREEDAPLAFADRARVEEAIFERLADSDALVLVDYDKGLFADGLGRRLVAAARERGIFVAADPKRELERFRGATLVKPNLAEAQAAVGFVADGAEGRAQLLEKLRARLSGSEVVVTRGGEGMSGLAADGRAFDVATERIAVYDVQGAGDTAMAALVLCRVAGAPLADACRVANAAAGIAVSKVGTAAVSRAELAARLARDSTTCTHEGPSESSIAISTKGVPRA